MKMDILAIGRLHVLKLMQGKPVSLAGIFLCLALLGIGQDFIQSNVRGIAFYWSESALYKIQWLIFIPLVPLGLWISRARVKLGSLGSVMYSLILIIAFSMLHLILASLSINLVSLLFFDHTYLVDQIFYYFFAEEFYLVGFVYFLGFLGFNLHSEKADFKNEPVGKTLTKIPIKVRRKWMQVPVGDIIRIQTERPYLAIYTCDERYLYTATLQEFSLMLDPSVFVRTHRSTIVNLHFVESIVSRNNGDYDVLLVNRETLRLSRNYAKEWKSRWAKFTPSS